MPSANAEIYFIGAMMFLILVISFSAVYIFVRQYKKETREREAAAERETEAAARER